MYTSEQWHYRNHTVSGTLAYADCWLCGKNRAVCRQKIKYETREQAEAAIAEIYAREGWASSLLRRYLCRECCQYHLTSVVKGRVEHTTRKRFHKQMAAAEIKRRKELE